MKLLRGIWCGFRKLFQNPAAFLLMAAGAVILFYSLLAYPFYTAVKVADMKETYQALSGVNFSELSAKDEEDTEILQGFSDGRFEIVITDDEFGFVYSNRTKRQVRQEQIVERYMIPYEEYFQEEPHIYIRKNKNFRSIRLRGLFIQGEGLETEGSREPETDTQEGAEGQKRYYVYIRLVVRSAGTAIRYTTKYLCAAAGLMFLLGYIVLRLKSMKLAFVPERTGGNNDDKGGVWPKDPGKNESSENDMKAQQEFVASVSHELKTPLAVISGQMEMLQSMGDRIDQDYYFTSIREEIDKMSRLVGNLLDLTIMEHQMEDMEMREINFSGMAKYMAGKYDALFQRNKIRLITEIEDGCVVYGNRTYLEQAVNNYIMNAFQHTPQGKEIRITLAREDDNAKLCVYNEGSVIPEEKLGQIWKGFYKDTGNEQINLREFRNAGLGLYLVEKITGIHHGSCGVRNVEGGVEFWLTLPLMGKSE